MTTIESSLDSVKTSQVNDNNSGTQDSTGIDANFFSQILNSANQSYNFNYDGSSQGLTLANQYAPNTNTANNSDTTRINDNLSDSKGADAQNSQYTTKPQTTGLSYNQASIVPDSNSQQQLISKINKYRSENNKNTESNQQKDNKVTNKDDSNTSLPQAVPIDLQLSSEKIPVLANWKNKLNQTLNSKISSKDDQQNLKEALRLNAKSDTLSGKSLNADASDQQKDNKVTDKDDSNANLLQAVPIDLQLSSEKIPVLANWKNKLNQTLNSKISNKDDEQNLKEALQLNAKSGTLSGKNLNADAITDNSKAAEPEKLKNSQPEIDKAYAMTDNSKAAEPEKLKNSQPEIDKADAITDNSKAAEPKEEAEADIVNQIKNPELQPIKPDSKINDVSLPKISNQKVSDNSPDKTELQDLNQQDENNPKPIDKGLEKQSNNDDQKLTKDEQMPIITKLEVQNNHSNNQPDLNPQNQQQETNFKFAASQVQGSGINFEKINLENVSQQNNDVKSAPSQLTNNIMDQVINKTVSDFSDNKSQITIALTPENLGKVEIDLISTKGALTAQITAEILR